MAQAVAVAVELSISEIMAITQEQLQLLPMVEMAEMQEGQIMPALEVVQGGGGGVIRTNMIAGTAPTRQVNRGTRGVQAGNCGGGSDAGNGQTQTTLLLNTNPNCTNRY